MNKYDSTPGIDQQVWFPFDLEYLQNAYSEAFQGILSYLPENCILSGCDVVQVSDGQGGSEDGWSDGFIKIGSEIFSFSEQVDSIWLKVNETIHPDTAAELNGDGSLSTAHKIRALDFQSVEPSSGEYVARSSIVRLNDDATAAANASGEYSGSLSVKRRGTTVYIRGVITVGGTPTTSNTMATIPAAFLSSDAPISFAVIHDGANTPLLQFNTATGAITRDYSALNINYYIDLIYTI